MKKLILFLSAVYLWAVSALSQTTVANLAVAQRPGTKLVDIFYDLSDPGTNSVRVFLAVSCGLQTVNATHLTGDIGDSVPVGSGKGIVWDMSSDWNGNAATGVVFTITVGVPAGGDPSAASWELVNARWTKNTYTNGAVTMSDRDSGNMWLYSVNTYSGQNWYNAMSYCDNLIYAGYSDWRLPDKDTLAAQYSQKTYFSGVHTFDFWSSTPYAGYTELAWCVGMGSGSIYYSYKSNGNIVWPMRDGLLAVGGTASADLDSRCSLTVTNGSGSGLYTNGQQVAITANSPVAGMSFLKWIGATQYVASITSATTSVTMPAQNISVTASYKSDFVFTTNNGTITITGYTGTGGAIAIPETHNSLPVVSITDDAFWYSNKGSFTSVTIPSSVTNIGLGAFSGCLNLTGFQVSESNTFFSSTNGVLFNKSQTILIQYPGTKSGLYVIPDSVGLIGATAFAFCTNLTGVTMPASVTNIGSGAFQGCQGLRNIVIGEGVLSINDSAFQGCSSATNLTIPSSVTNIGVSAFANGYGLTQVTLGNRVQTVGTYAFSYCTSLATVLVPASVSSLGAYAFSSCTNLTGIYFAGNAPSAGSDVFHQDTGTTVYYMPGTTGWTNTFVSRPATLWLTLTGGTAQGPHTNLQQVAIAADIPEGMTFTAWTGATQYVADVLAPQTTVAMPLQNISVTAFFQSPGPMVAPTNLATDGFDGSSGSLPDSSKFEWGGQIGLNAGQVVLSTDTANQSWLKTKAGAAPERGQALVLKMKLYAYAEPAVYGDLQPRGLREGNDANNAIEFYSAYGTTIGMRAVKDGAAVQVTYPFPSGVASMHDYEISVTATAVTFWVDGVLTGTITSSIPDGVLNAFISTYDGGFGNVPVVVDSLDLVLADSRDANANSIPDSWDRQYFGSVNVESSTVCSNRINTVLEAYVAGLDPNDPLARFAVTVPSRDVLQWQAVSGRVCSIYWATNLLSGFQCLESNIPWPRCSTTNPVSNPYGYYKVNIRMAE